MSDQFPEWMGQLCAKVALVQSYGFEIKNLVLGIYETESFRARLEAQGFSRPQCIGLATQIWGIPVITSDKKSEVAIIIAA